MQKIFISATEPSGDLLGANLILDLYKNYNIDQCNPKNANLNNKIESSLHNKLNYKNINLRTTSIEKDNPSNSCQASYKNNINNNTCNKNPFTQEQFPTLEIQIIGGEKMQLLGYKSLFNINATSIMGIIEVIPKLFTIIKLINTTIEFLIKYQPDIIITIDSPGFHNALIKKIRKLIKKNPELFKKNLKIIHYAAPSVWAWRPNRAKKLAQIYDMLIVLFPFEGEYFEKYNLRTKFYGHPLFKDCNNCYKILHRSQNNEKIQNDINKPNKISDKINYEQFFKYKLSLVKNFITNTKTNDEKEHNSQNYKGNNNQNNQENNYTKNNEDIKSQQISTKDNEIRICIMPGSREGEINKMAPVLIETIKLFNNYTKNKNIPIKFFIITIKDRLNLINKYFQNTENTIIITENKEDILMTSTFAITKTGTITLEIAKFMLNSISIYKTSKITAFIVKILIKINNTCLINILTKSQTIPELLQENCCAEKIFQKSLEILQNPDLQKQQLSAYKHVIEQLMCKDNINLD